MRFKKYKLLLLLLLALLLANISRAADPDLSAAYALKDTQNSMAWPMLPNESVQDLAAKFYPNDRFMQRQFIARTKTLNTEKLSTKKPYKKLTAITIPNIKKLSASAGSVKRAKTRPNRTFSMSYNIKSKTDRAKETIRNIPEHLLLQYESLLARNDFLKEEIAKLNKRLVFLHNKLGELKLVLDRTLTWPPPKKAIKNLDAQQNDVEHKVDKPETIMVDLTAQEQSAQPSEKQSVRPVFFNLSNKLLWLSLLGLGLLVMFASYLFKKYQERRYIAHVNKISRQKQVIEPPLESETANSPPPVNVPLGAETVVEEHNEHKIMLEAQSMVKKGLHGEAVEHLKWAIRAEYKTAIQFWLLLLDIFRAQDKKEAFEQYASEMHQTFNIITPQWEQKEAAVVIPQSLEEHPHILELLTNDWPQTKVSDYLVGLVSDNRSGQRSGFSLAVVEEILLLIKVLELREHDDR